jgi:hypothetical protein
MSGLFARRRRRRLQFGRRLAKVLSVGPRRERLDSANCLTVDICGFENIRIEELDDELEFENLLASVSERRRRALGRKRSSPVTLGYFVRRHILLALLIAAGAFILLVSQQ